MTERHIWHDWRLKALVIEIRCHLCNQNSIGKYQTNLILTLDKFDLCSCDREQTYNSISVIHCDAVTTHLITHKTITYKLFTCVCISPLKNNVIPNACVVHGILWRQVDVNKSPIIFQLYVTTSSSFANIQSLGAYRSHPEAGTH